MELAGPRPEGIMHSLFDLTIPRRWILRLLAVGGLGFLGLAVGSVVLLNHLSRDLPSPTRLANIQPAVKTVLFAADGDTLREFFTENRTVVPLDRIPRSLQEAVVAIEDKRFYDHYGIDPRRLVRVLWDNIVTSGRPGASTLTQQLARNLFLTSDKTLTRKVKEWILALQIEQIYTKDEILAMYLNQIYMGRGSYGMQAAARLYFDKDVWDLQPAETTLLAGIIQRPNSLSPFDNLESAYKRRATVLQTMVAAGFLSREEAERIGATEVAVVPAERSHGDDRFAAYFIEEIRKHLEQTYGAEKLYDEGLRVWTTLVPRYQRWMEKAAEDHLVALEEEYGYRVNRARYDALARGGKRPEKAAYLQCGALLQDVHTGAVLAMLGGRSFADSKWNHAWQAERQPGSVFKPFVYLTALEHGYTTASILQDTPFALDTGSGVWQPKNFGGKFSGPVTLRYALSRSINVPTAKFYLDFGLDPVVQNAKRLGIESKLPRVPALFLGAGDVTLREVVGAYSAFANQGVFVVPHLITRVETLDGEILEQTRLDQREAIDPKLAYLVVDLLHTALKEGTGRKAATLGFTANGAGKTGTTNESTNAWFCGFTPNLCAGVWVGFDDPTPMGRTATGGHLALPIWAGFMGRIAREQGDAAFPRPAGLEERAVCLQTGLLASARCDSVAAEIFLRNTVPTETCDGKHRAARRASPAAEPAEPVEEIEGF
jgi:penicillin-binding protein 1A